MRTLVLVALSALASAAAPAADAARVDYRYSRTEGSVKGTPTIEIYSLAVVAGAGEANRMSVQATGATIRVRDAGAPLTAGENCRPDGDGVLCEQAPRPGGGVLSHRIDLGDGDDELDIAGLPYLILTAGPGDDRVNAPDYPLTFDGGPGADRLRAKGGTVTYEGRTAGVSVSADDVANDGEPGEGDDVGSTFNTVIGGSGPDELHAGATAAELDGRGGADRLFGGPGDDRLIGAAGPDSLDGAAGSDALVPGTEDDVVRGGPGSDFVDLNVYGSAGVDVTLDDRPGDGTPGENDDIGSDIERVRGTSMADRIVGSDAPNNIEGVDGADLLDGGGGPDQIFGGGGADRLIGGSGEDRLTADGNGGSVEALDGEQDLVSCQGGRGNTIAADPFDLLRECGPTVDFVTARPLAHDGTWKVRLVCRGGTGPRCAGRLYVRGYGRLNQAIVGRLRFDLATGVRTWVKVRITKAGRAEVARKKYLEVSVKWRTASTDPPARRTGDFGTALGPKR